MTKQNRVDQHLLALMTQGREYTANDIAVKINMRPEAVKPHLTRMAKAGKLASDQITGPYGSTSIYSLPRAALEGRG